MIGVKTNLSDKNPLLTNLSQTPNKFEDCDVNEIDKLKLESEKLKSGMESLKQQNLDLCNKVQEYKMNLTYMENEIFKYKSCVHKLNMELNWSKEQIHKSNRVIATAGDRYEALIENSANISRLVTHSLTVLRKINSLKKESSLPNIGSHCTVEQNDSKQKLCGLEEEMKKILSCLIDVTSNLHNIRDEFEIYFNSTTQGCEDNSIQSSRSRDSAVEDSPENKNVISHNNSIRLRSVTTQASGDFNICPDLECSPKLAKSTVMDVSPEVEGLDRNDFVFSTILEISAEERDSLVAMSPFSTNHPVFQFHMNSSPINETKNNESSVLTNVTTRKPKKLEKGTSKEENFKEEDITTASQKTEIQNLANIVQVHNTQEESTNNGEETKRYQSQRLKAKRSSMKLESITLRHSTEMQTVDALQPQIVETQAVVSGKETKQSQKQKGKKSLKKQKPITSSKELEVEDITENKSAKHGRKKKKEKKQNVYENSKKYETTSESEDLEPQSDEEKSRFGKKETQRRKHTSSRTQNSSTRISLQTSEGDTLDTQRRTRRVPVLSYAEPKLTKKLRRE